MRSILYPVQRLIGAAAGVLFLSPVRGQGAEDRPVLPSPIGSPDILNVGGGLLIVVLAIVLVGVLYARTQGRRGGSNGVISVVASQAIGPKERILVVEVADKQLLLGMTTASVRTLHVFEEPMIFASDPVTGFASRLRSVMRGSEK
jgi:flagellar protein FliO/FliZ